MSRIGNKPIALGDKVEVAVKGRTVTVKGPKATLEHTLPAPIAAAVEDKQLIVTRTNEQRQTRALHGLSRSLLANMVEGVDQGFKKQLEIRGVGYRAQVQGRKLVLNVGYSQPVEYEIPADVTVNVENNTQVTVEGADKQRVGQVAAIIRGFRPPEVYKGKGIRYVGEYVLQKEGKTV